MVRNPRNLEGDITIPKDVLGHVFDLAINSMDFSSGFMDDEDVETLREIAVLLGVNPSEATPLVFKCKYEPHEHYDPVQLSSLQKVGSSVDWARKCQYCLYEFPEGE